MERKCRMRIGEPKQNYGDKICLIGNVEESSLLPFGFNEQVAKQIRECTDVAAPGGGYIFASDHGIHLGIPRDRARFLFETEEEHRKSHTASQFMPLVGTRHVF